MLGKLIQNLFYIIEYDRAPFHPFYRLMCEDIRRERGRIGGDWAVAQFVMTREMRDTIRAELGPELVFVLLEMDPDAALSRLSRRHSGNEKALEMVKVMILLLFIMFLMLLFLPGIARQV